MATETSFHGKQYTLLCWLLEVQGQIFHAYSERIPRSTTEKKYTEMREKGNNRDNYF